MNTAFVFMGSEKKNKKCSAVLLFKNKIRFELLVNVEVGTLIDNEFSDLECF